MQQIPSRLLQLLESDDQVSMPQYVVVTDAVVHSTWINKGVDKYFLPNEISKRMLIQRGVNADAMHVSGIPVDLKIAEPKVKAEMRSQHDFPADQPIITLLEAASTLSGSAPWSWICSRPKCLDC